MNKNPLITSKPTSIVYTPQSRGIAHQDLNYFKDVTKAINPNVINLQPVKTHPWEVSILKRYGNPWGSPATCPSIYIAGGIWNRNNIECIIRDDKNIFSDTPSLSAVKQASIIEFDANVQGEYDAGDNFIDLGIYVTIGTGIPEPSVLAVESPTTLIEPSSGLFTEPEWAWVSYERPLRGWEVYGWAGSFNVLDQLSYINHRKIATVRLKMYEGEYSQIVDIKQHINTHITDEFRWDDRSKVKPWQIIHFNGQDHGLTILNDVLNINRIGAGQLDFQFEQFTEPPSASPSKTLSWSADNDDKYVLLQKIGTEEEDVTYDLTLRTAPATTPSALNISDAAKLIYRIKSDPTYFYPTEVAFVDNTNSILIGGGAPCCIEPEYTLNIGVCTDFGVSALSGYTENEYPYIDKWTCGDLLSGDNSAISGENVGVEFKLVTRIVYDPCGSNTLWQFIRPFTFDPCGKLYDIGPEVRHVIDTPVLYSEIGE